MIKIVQNGESILREKAKSVPKDDIRGAHIKAVIQRMKTAMHSQKDGIAIAAPQIGEQIKLFIVSGAMLKLADKTYKGDEKDLIFINPVLTKKSREKKEVEEGCLSVRWLYGKVSRSNRVMLEALDENGTKVTRGASGLLAQIFQHECDHLEGILFIDKARELWELTPEEIAELEAK